jgi:DNA-binding transcriptional MerR regulator
MAEGGLFIGKVAEQVGVNAKTIRYYETIGLLPKPGRSESGYRVYPKEVIELLRFIKKAQSLGLKLSEIGEIVALYRKGQAPCGHVQSLLERKIVELDQRLDDLLALRKKLSSLLAATRGKAKPGRMRAAVCPHIERVTLEPNPSG